jgi:NAD(P)-dependent dehydrogenase (short-subunit alcohol dehydrogenase family)
MAHLYAGFQRAGISMADHIIRTALVTGAARRIGKAIVQSLAADGIAVAIHANGSIGAAQALADDIGASGGRAVAIQADLRDPASRERMMKEARSALGPLGLLVNNASIFRNDSADRFEEESFDAHFDVHVKAPLHLSALFADGVPQDGRGLIVNIVDQRVWALNPRFCSYTLSKAALWTATQTLAQAYAPRIRVNAIGPGPTLANERQSAEDFRKQSEGVLLKRGPELGEFGRTIRYLMETPSITGQMIALDGGQHLAWQTPDVADIAE